jgi:DNA-directed RNA polymerase subunit M/transcription elongation factor TFIIS
MELITIKTFDNYFSASILLTRLQSEGVDCWLKDEHTVTIDPLLTNAVGGIKLVVRDEDAKAVMQLLQQYEEELRQKLHCPMCGGRHFNYVTKQSAVNYLTAIATFMFSRYAVALDYVYQCADCGYEAKELSSISDEKGFKG